MDSGRDPDVHGSDELAPVGGRVGAHGDDRDAARRGARVALVGRRLGGRHRDDPVDEDPLRHVRGEVNTQDRTGEQDDRRGPATVAALKPWKRSQAEDRLLMGAGWQDRDGLVVTIADGSAPNPEAFSNLFRKLARRAGLRPIRLHDLRHSYATAALAAGVPVKVVSQRIGHAYVGVTLKVYAQVMPGDDEAAAQMADRLISP